MRANEGLTPPRWYSVVAVLAVLWMLAGVGAWFMDLLASDAMLAGMTEAQRQLYLARPGWIFLLYAVATFTGLAGAVGLLLRQAWAVPTLAVSLAAAVVQFGHLFLIANAVSAVGAATAIPLPAAVIVIGSGLLWLAISAVERGWIPRRERAARAEPAAY
jgi:hypothetical protein